MGDRPSLHVDAEPPGIRLFTWAHCRRRRPDSDREQTRMIIELAQNTDLGRTRANATAWVATFVMIEVVALVLIVTQVLPQVLPDRLATQIGHNSESFVLAIILSLQVAWLRARRKASAGFDSQHRQVTADGATMFVVALCSIVI